jgi:hypothetical protein
VFPIIHCFGNCSSVRKSIVSTVRDDDVIEYTTDPELIFEKWQNLVDMVIDGMAIM